MFPIYAVCYQPATNIQRTYYNRSDYQTQNNSQTIDGVLLNTTAYIVGRRTSACWIMISTLRYM